MVREPEKSSIPFRDLADKLYGLKAITSNVADNAKNQYSDLLKIAKYEQNDAFVKFNFLIFKSNFLTTNDFKDIWHIYFFLTAIWLSHSQLWAILQGTASLTRC